MDRLIIIHANTEALLQPYRQKCTHWLPENDVSIRPKYQPPEIICTTIDTFPDLIKALIQDEKISHDKVIYIEVENFTMSLVYTFGPDGIFNNFFRL